MVRGLNSHGNGGLIPVPTKSDMKKDWKCEREWCWRAEIRTQKSQPFERLEAFVFCCTIEIPTAMNKVHRFEGYLTRFCADGVMFK